MFLTFACGETGVDSIRVVSFRLIEYDVTGGFVGVRLKTVIDSNGNAVFSYYRSNKKYCIAKKLTDEQLDRLNLAFDEYVVLRLQNEYKPEHPIADGFSYHVKYVSAGGITKDISASDGADIPFEFKNILTTLGEINRSINSEPEYATLISAWEGEGIVKNWIFTDVILESNTAYYYDSLENAGQIIDYFRNVNDQYGNNILFLSGDSLYSIYDGGKSYGYFRVYRSYPAILWNDVFDFDVNEALNEGISKQLYEWESIGLQPGNTYAFILDKIEDNGRVVQVRLVPGVPCNDD
ncbi:hypothetical protein MROS_2586 [Melioribacter roseus P3M-2]|uniref:Uncharacterized protein n=1 Tax=Melioribacter roseus (strain DSM 23840 / JCM 17771 / VKM B-2668 / P3M-2) TaxID=1191523 RepID=I7A7G2_MELRP|nr:hypothetical protein [Melioribacter roseus]AFN75816.1 hypothetical protein MROS_2586 [Melioribacter roseus P3M-2]